MVEIYNNPNKNGCCCLLFIDNPVEYTDKIIKILDETDVKASFFFGVKNMKKYIETIKNTCENGHTIGLNLDSQYNFLNMSKKEIQNKIQEQINVLGDIIGNKIKYIYINEEYINNNDILESINNLDLKIINYSYEFNEIHDEKINELKIFLEASDPKYTSFNILLYLNEYKLQEKVLHEIIDIIKSAGYGIITIMEAYD